MSTHKWIDRICVIVVVLSLVVTALFMNGERPGIELVSDTDAEGYISNEYFTANDLNGTWDTSEATVITLSGDTAKISGNGAYWLDGSVVIVQSGQYVFSGVLTDGNIVVDAAQYSKVWIQLNGVTVSCSDDACIRVDQADKVFLTLAEGTENTLTGGDTFSETALADGTNAVIFSHDDLTINGTGNLTVISSYLNGITSKDDLIITGGTISVTAPNHGLRVNDHFRMTSAALTVSAEQDGIHSKGDIVIHDGTLTITAGDDAVHSDTSVLILDGTILVNDCYEGIEAVTIEISGGDTTIHTRDDGLNANGYTGFEFGGGMDMQGQMPEISANPFPGEAMPFPGNDPEDPAETTVASESNAASGEDSEQNAESTPILSGSIASETGDAESAAGEAPSAAGSEQTQGMPSGRPEHGTMMPFGEGFEFGQEDQTDSAEEKTVVSAEDTWILISGGKLTILNENGRDADGIDSNGNIMITGGEILVSLAGSGGNNALDFGSESGGTMAITRGTVIACGDGSMAEGFGLESTQASILYSLTQTAAAGSSVTLLDAEGKELITETIPYSFSCIVISCPDLTVDDTYTIRIGETEETIEMTSVSVSAGTASSTMMTQGIERPSGEGMGPGAFGDGGTPPERPDGDEGFGFPENSEGFSHPEGGFGPPSMTQGASATAGPVSAGASEPSETHGTSEENVTHQPPDAASRQDRDTFAEKPASGNGTEPTADTDSTSAWILVLGSVLCLVLGLMVALIYKRSQHIDT